MWWMQIAIGLTILVVAFFVRIALMRSFLSDLAGEKFSFGLVLKRNIVAILLSILIIALAGVGMLYLSNLILLIIVPIVLFVVLILIYTRMLYKFLHNRRKVFRVIVWDYGISFMFSVVIGVVAVASWLMSVVDMAKDMILWWQGSGQMGMLQSQNDQKNTDTDTTDSVVIDVRDLSGDITQNEQEQNNAEVTTWSVDNTKIEEEDSTEDVSVDVSSWSVAVVAEEKWESESEGTDASAADIERIMWWMIEEESETVIIQEEARQQIQNQQPTSLNEREWLLTPYVQTYIDQSMYIVGSSMEQCQQTLYVWTDQQNNKRWSLITHTSDGKVYEVDIFVAFSDGTREKFDYGMLDTERGTKTVSSIARDIASKYSIDNIQKMWSEKTIEWSCGYIQYTNNTETKQRIMTPSWMWSYVNGIVVQ